MSFADYISSKITKLPNWLNTILLHCNVFRGLVYGTEYLNFKKNNVKIDPDKALLDIVNFAIKNVKYYRDRYNNLTINSIEDFKTEIGFIDKNEVMLYWNDFLVDNINLSECVQSTTGGTNGKPLNLVNVKNRYAIELAVMHSIWERAGWNYNSRGVIRNHKLPSGQIYIINPITKEYIFDAFRMSPEYARTIYNVLKQKHIYFVHAYPSAAFQFCKLCHNQNLDLSFLKSFLCGSEEVTEEQRRFICEEIGVNIHSWYGHSEKLVLGGFCEGNKMMHIEPSYGYFELINEQKKDVAHSKGFGEIVGTTLYNRVMPLVRYRTGDFADFSGSSCSSCNKRLPLLSKIYGRWDKSIIYRADNTTTSLTALNLHSELYTHIDNMQYLQEEKGKLTVLIIKNSKYTKETENKLIAHFKYGMGEGSIVEIQYVEELIHQPNGKFLSLISKIEQ